MVYDCAAGAAGTFEAFCTAGAADAPPHELSRHMDSANDPSIKSFQTLFRENTPPVTASPATPKIGRNAAYNALVLPAGYRSSAEADRVKIVRVDVALLLPGGMDEGENEQATPAGRLEHERESDSCNEPVTVTLVVPDCPH
jgi:hypothetical protein